MPLSPKFLKHPRHQTRRTLLHTRNTPYGPTAKTALRAAHGMRPEYLTRCHPPKPQASSVWASNIGLDWFAPLLSLPRSGVPPVHEGGPKGSPHVSKAPTDQTDRWSSEILPGRARYMEPCHTAEAAHVCAHGRKDSLNSAVSTRLDRKSRTMPTRILTTRYDQFKPTPPC